MVRSSKRKGMGRAGGASVIYRRWVLTQDHPRPSKSLLYLFSLFFLTLSTFVPGFIVITSLIHLLYAIVYTAPSPPSRAFQTPT